MASSNIPLDIMIFFQDALNATQGALENFNTLVIVLP
jgi:hypothetical protein